MKIILVVLIVSLFQIALTAEPNPPNWPSSVYILDPATPSVSQSLLDNAFAKNGGNTPAFNGQWSNSRYAFLFKPGVHNVNVNVGYYTSIIGLGLKPSDTSILKVTCQNGDFDYSAGALDNFWREASNFYTKPSVNWNNSPTPSMMWAVSQASPLRSVYIDGDLSLWQYNYGCCAGYSSGGFISNSIVNGSISSGSQQQFFTRNTQASWTGGNWNMVFVGNSNTFPASHCSNTDSPPYTTISNTPVIAEKPYIILNDNNKYSLVVPNVKKNSVGPTTNFGDANVVDFENVYVATETDSASLINSKLASGLFVVLTGGTYNLTSSIIVGNNNAVVLGIGFPTLVAANGQPAIVVTASEGARIGGILLQAGSIKTSALLVWGKNDTGNSQNPGILYDCFARVGGTNNPSIVQLTADTMVVIAQGFVVIDNSWLWRADHGIYGEVYNQDNPTNHGLQVYGSDVTTYGLAVEHELQNLVEWFGERGSVYFFQAELPYDVTQAFGNSGYCGFYVDPSVTQFQAYGIGVYSFFRDHNVTINNAISSGSSSGVSFVNSLTVFLSGNGRINHVINGQGNPVDSPGTTSYVCNAN